MIRSLYTTVSGLISLENKQATITNNMANANNTGFKSQVLSIKSFDEVMLQNMDNKVGNTYQKQRLGKLSLGAEIDTVNTKFTQGTLKSTGKATDMAVDGRGFFTVARDKKVLYTRDGSFKVGNDGYLMTTSGDKVLGINRITGNMEPLYVGTGDFTIDKLNNVNVKGVSTHSLAMADFDDYSKLSKVGENYFDGTAPKLTNQVFVAQGNLESANVNLANEMVDMITTMRSFETNQKMIQTLDDTLGKAANEIGAVR